MTTSHDQPREKLKAYLDQDPRLRSVVTYTKRRFGAEKKLTAHNWEHIYRDTINAIIQSMRYSVFNHPLGVNWVIVTIYVPALLVSSALILWQLLRSPAATALPATAST